jgi:hypothetical protein
MSAAPDRAEIERTLLALVDARAPGRTICPSEVARALAGAEFRPLMEPVRETARELVARGELEVTQRGQVVDPHTARGPIRLRRPPAP